MRVSGKETTLTALDLSGIQSETTVRSNAMCSVVSSNNLKGMDLESSFKSKKCKSLKVLGKMINWTEKYILSLRRGNIFYNTKKEILSQGKENV